MMWLTSTFAHFLTNISLGTSPNFSKSRCARELSCCRPLTAWPSKNIKLLTVTNVFAGFRIVCLRIQSKSYHFKVTKSLLVPKEHNSVVFSATYGLTFYENLKNLKIKWRRSLPAEKGKGYLYLVILGRVCLHLVKFASHSQ